MLTPPNQPGATPDAQGCTFRIWAPRAKQAELILEPEGKVIALEAGPDGYWHVYTDARPGQLYRFRLDGSNPHPDPASRHQPQGVHGPSEVTDLRSFPWQHPAWTGIAQDDLVFYELHVGTFTKEGTLDAAIRQLDDLAELGVTCVEIMPVAQFPGERNWGYDGAHPYAVQHSYGGPDALMRFVDACHGRGLAVCLDVVYNHLGPEGNYLWGIADYFTERYKTPWGGAVNYDGPGSDPVRDYFIGNAMQWLRDFRIDVLRLDATHAIFDFSAKPFLEEMAEQAKELSAADGQRRYLIAESDSNDPRLIRPPALGGFGLHGQWCDDFHHALHTLLTDENEGYYRDFNGVKDFAKSFKQGYVYTGKHARARGRRHGRLPENCFGNQFVVCMQNHDQVGNRMMGDRMTALAGFEQLKLGAGLLLLSPFLPLLFMGEEYGEDNPFQYFVSHGDKGLVEAVRKGRKEEFADFSWKGEVPDPQSEKTFVRSRLEWKKKDQGHHRQLRELYKRLLKLRREEPALQRLDMERAEAIPLPKIKCLLLRRRQGQEEVLTLANCGEQPQQFPSELLLHHYERILSTTEEQWGGSGEVPPSAISPAKRTSLPPWSCTIYRMKEENR